MNKNQQITTARLKIRFFWQYCEISTSTIFHIIVYNILYAWLSPVGPFTECDSSIFLSACKNGFFPSQAVYSISQPPLHHDYYVPVLHVITLRETFKDRRFLRYQFKLSPENFFTVHYNMMHPVYYPVGIRFRVHSIRSDAPSVVPSLVSI